MQAQSRSVEGVWSLRRAPRKVTEPKGALKNLFHGGRLSLEGQLYHGSRC